jgi:hypothetical protein
MKSILLFIAFVLSLSCSNSVKQVREYYDDGTLKCVYEMCRGLKHGKYFEYYQSGSIKSQSNWINDTITGLSVHYSESGNVESTTMRLKGQLHGNYVKHDETGLLVQTKNYQYNKQFGYDMRYQEGYLLQLNHYVLIGDSTHLNQWIVIDYCGTIHSNYSAFYSIYNCVESDTIQLNQKVELITCLETPYTGFSKWCFCVRKSDNYFDGFDNNKKDSMFIENPNYALWNVTYFKTGFKYAHGYLLVPYLDQNGIEGEHKFYFQKQFYVRE